MSEKKKMLAYKDEIETYTIGENFFAVHPNTGVMHEITTGRKVTTEEWEAVKDYIDTRS